jgi:hypothetical protein
MVRVDQLTQMFPANYFILDWERSISLSFRSIGPRKRQRDSGAGTESIWRKPFRGVLQAG